MIVTTYVRPPVPTTMFDWMAHIEGDEEGPTGRGPTEAEALRDLCEQLAELLAQRDELAAALECVLRDHLAVHGVGDVEMQPSLFQARAALSRIKGA